MTRRVLAPLLVLLVLLLTGCDRYALNSLALPGTQGRGDGAYEVKLQMPNVGNLVPNNPVRLHDIEVGNIRHIDLDGWHAVVTVSLNRDVSLPRDVVARVGQASLLGAKYIELDEPTGPAKGAPIPAGYTVPLAQTGRYPETEDTLAAVAAMLNGGGLQQVRTISTELNRAMSGRTPQYRSLLTQLNTFAAGLDAQKADIVRAIDGLDRMSAGLAAQDKTLNDALVAFPPALDTLQKERKNLVDTLVALGQFGDQADRVFRESDDNLAANLDDLRPALKGLADAGDSLTQSLYLLGSLVFPIKSFPYFFRGDYINFWLNLDLTLPTLDRNFLTGTPAAGSLGRAQQELARAIGGGPTGPGSPLLSPLRPPGPADGQQKDGSAMADNGYTSPKETKKAPPPPSKDSGPLPLPKEGLGNGLLPGGGNN
ncbi:MCE family protein [Pseudonocardia spinosispora]|uniref:MCE family protein n=1 Tax=Pseudonocardia spinosispora TaxID=103441 RepID=UPI001FE031F3|nr:MCE family protein [Pseudonocardia spinosispora]